MELELAQTKLQLVEAECKIQVTSGGILWTQQCCFEAREWWGSLLLAIALDCLGLCALRGCCLQAASWSSSAMLKEHLQFVWRPELGEFGCHLDSVPAGLTVSQLSETCPWQVAMQYISYSPGGQYKKVVSQPLYLYVKDSHFVPVFLSLYWDVHFCLIVLLSLHICIFSSFYFCPLTSSYFLHLFLKSSSNCFCYSLLWVSCFAH